MLKNGYIICFQILNHARTQILITSSTAAIYRNFSINVLLIPYLIINIYCRTLPSGCFNVPRVVKHFKVAITVPPQKRFRRHLLCYYTLNYASKSFCLTIFSRFWEEMYYFLLEQNDHIDGLFRACLN